jgi:DNA-binding XRE family transcriptional regulator/tetratricopeptide (TPR) repeat protein
MNHFLKNARAIRFLSIDKASALVGVEPRTFKRWERDDYNPQLYFLKKLCDAFNAEPEELGYSISADGKVFRIASTQLEVRSHLNGIIAVEHIGYPLIAEEADGKGPGAERNWTGWFGLKQAQIFRMISLCSDPACCEDIQIMVDQEIRMIDDTLEQHQVTEEQAISRRQALAAIAALPLTLLAFRSGPLVDTMNPEFLPQCAASITACWHLLRGKGGLPTVDEILPQFVPLLRTLAQNPSKYQKTAARLAAQASILQGILAMHRLNFASREAHCKDAVRYATIAKDGNLRAAALTYLGYTYSFCYMPRKPERAIQVFLEALQSSSEEVPLLRCNIQMGLAEAYAQCKEEQQALHFIHLAQTNFPAYPEQDPSYIFGDCSLHVLYQWEGKMYLELVEHYTDRGYQQKAAAALMQGAGVHSISERSTTETVIYQADASRVLGELDMYASSLSQAAQMAIDLRSRKRYSEAILVYQRTPERWLRERQIQSLARNVFGQLPNGQPFGRK